MSSKTNRQENADKDRVENKQTGCGDIVNNFIEDIWTVMTPEMSDRLKCVLRDDMGLSKQDVDNFIKSQREVRRQRICLRKAKRNVRIGPRNQWIKELSKDIADQMGSFIVGILLSKRTARTKRITERVLERLCEITGENTTVENAGSRVERTLVVVADRMAKWIDEAITDIERCMDDKYMSAASLEALSVNEVDLCHIIKTPSSSEESVVRSEISIISEESKIAASTISIISQEREESFKKEEKKQKEKVTKEGDTDTGDSEVTEDESAPEESEEESETESEVSEIEEEIEEEAESLGEEEDKYEEEVEEEELEDEVEEEETLEDEVQEEEVEDEEKIYEENMDEETEGEQEDVDEGEFEELAQQIVKVESSSEGKSKDSVVEFSNTSSEQDLQQLTGDILDLLKEDITRISREEEKTDRQKAMKKIIDKRLEIIAKEKLDQSLNSLLKYDIDDTASIIASWMEKVLSAADDLPKVSSAYESQGPAFEVKRGDGSQYQVYKISSTSVAQKVAEVRGMEPPLRKNKLPKTMSPMDLKAGNEWADWAIGATNVGEKWGDWLDTAISDVEKHLLSDKSSKSHKQNYEDWNNWRSQRSIEARKWRAEKQKIRDEGSLWKRKLEKGSQGGRLERQTRTYTF